MSFKSHVTLANSKIRIFDKWSSSLSTCMQVLLPKRCQFRAKKNPKSSWQLSYLSGHIATLLQPKKVNSWSQDLGKLRAVASKHGVPKPFEHVWFSQKKMGSCGVNYVLLLQPWVRFWIRRSASQAKVNNDTHKQKTSTWKNERLKWNKPVSFLCPNSNSKQLSFSVGQSVSCWSCKEVGVRLTFALSLVATFALL